MNVFDKGILPAKPVEQALEAVMFVATAVLFAGGTIAMCLPGAVLAWV